jgi:hypothetical protein
MVIEINTKFQMDMVLVLGLTPARFITTAHPPSNGTHPTAGTFSNQKRLP